MRSVALKGLAARPVRTLLTTLAIVLGVAMISGALTLTDTMRGGADGLTKAAYDGTDAVVTAKTAFAVSSSDYTAKKPTVDASMLERVRSVPQVAALAIGAESGWPLLALAGILSEVVTTPFVAAATVLLYLDLRVRNEGLDIEIAARQLLDLPR